MMEIESEQEAANAMMQLYLSPATPGLVPHRSLQAAVPALSLDNVNVPLAKQQKPNKLFNRKVTDLIVALENGMPRKIKRSNCPRRLSLSKKNGTGRGKHNRLVDSPIEILPRLRSHARGRRRGNSISIAYGYNKKRSGSTDSEDAFSDPTGVSSYGSNVRRDKIGNYTPEERTVRLQQFLEKRKRRVWSKKIKYRVRKNFADSRLRVKGRFISKENESFLREALFIAM